MFVCAVTAMTEEVTLPELVPNLSKHCTDRVTKPWVHTYETKETILNYAAVPYRQFEWHFVW